LLVPLLFFNGWVSADEWQVNEDVFFAKRSPQLVVNTAGDAFVGYYNEQNQIMVRPYKSRPVALNAGETRGRATGLAMTAAGGHLYAAWREQRKKETVLLLRHSADKGTTWGDEIVIDGFTGALTRIELTADGNGRVHIVWLGERVLADEQATVVTQQPPTPADKKTERARSYHLYARRSMDHGKTWGDTHRLTAGYTESIWPTLLTRGDRAYSFSWSHKDGKKLIIFSKTQTDGTWQTPVVIQEVNDVLILKSYWAGERLLVLWLNKTHNDFVIEGAFSDDEGQRWTPFVLEGSRGLDVANLEWATQGRQAYLVFSARTVQRSEPWQQTVYLARSRDAGATWEKPRVLRHYPFPYTKALYPRIVAVDGQEVAVVWNDYRNIRGDLYLNYSKDAGAAWLNDDLPLDAPGLHNDYLDPFAGAFAKAGDHYVLLASRYRGDSFASAVDVFLHRFELPKPATVTNDKPDAPGTTEKQQLRATAERLWGHLLKGDYKAAYPLFDPFFRANHREVDYLASTGRLAYRAFAIKDIALYGNVARVGVDFEYEIPEIVTKQGKFSRPLTKASTVETWVYVLDHWYKEYRNELGGFTYTRY
jgi:hypothetical protein